MFGSYGAKRNATRLAIAGLLATGFATLPASHISSPSQASTALYAFTSHTFDTCGASGMSGPSVTTCSDNYVNAGASWATSTNLREGEFPGFQQWRVPVTGVYELEVVGASGGKHLYAEDLNTGNFEPKGARIVVEIELTAGDWIQFVVGQRGGDTRTVESADIDTIDNAAPGGGGASWVFVHKDDAEPLVAAGGGGGGTRNDYSGSDANFSSTSGNSGEGHNNAGTDGNGGLSNSGGASFWAGAGSGWKTNGTGGNNTNYDSSAGTDGAGGGSAPKDGATGGLRYNDGLDEGGDGGFGGGGGGGSDNMGTGGGGGYSGGGGGKRVVTTNENSGGGGGGSFFTNSATLKASSLATSTGHGFVKVTLIAGAPDQLVLSTTGPFTAGDFDANGIWVTSTPSGTARVSVSAVLGQLATGAAVLEAKAGSLTVESDVISSFANNLTLKATTDVVINPGVDIDVGAGDLVLWSDAGNSGTGRIALNAGSELKTNGGNITIGGGANPASGYSIGRYGLYMENGSIDAGSGSVIINGRSNGSVDSSIGVSILSQSSIVGGSVSISGHISANATTAANSFGIRLANSVISASQVVLDGRDVSGTSKTGIQHWGLYLLSSTISASVQGAQLTGVGSNSTGSDIFGTAIISSNVDALQGPIRINGQAGSNGSGNKSGLRISNSTIGKKATDVELIATGGTGFGLDASGVVVGSNSTTTNLSISATAISQSTPLVFNTLGGDFSVRPLGASFTKAFTNDLFDVSGVNNYTIGPDGRSGGVAIKEGISVSGQVNVTAREIDVRSSISSITGPVVLKATQKVSMRSNVDIRTGGQDIVLWGDSAQANFGNVELLGSNSLQSNGGDIYLAGGADDGTGKPAGFAVVTNPTSEGGVRLGSGYQILSDGGEVFLRGRAKLSAAGDADGVHLNGHGIIDSGAGSISISGELDGIFGFNSDAVAFRLGTSGPDQTQHQIRSQNSGPTALQISGDASSDSSGAASGIGSSNTHDRAGRLAVSIEAPGAITIHGRGSSAAFFSQLGSNFFGAGIRLNSTLISSSSTVSLTATKGSQDAEKTWGIEFDALPSQGVTSVVSAGTDITIGSDSITFSNVAISAPGSIILEPLGSSFVSSGSTLPLLTNGLAQVPQSLRIGKSGNSGGVSLPANLEAANEIKIFAGKVESSTDISTSDLVISSTDQISLTGDVGFDRLEVASSKAGLTSGDIVIGSTRSYLVADLDSSFVGSYGVPKVLEFLPLPSSATEDTAFEIAARVGKDAYGFPMQSLNRTPASFAIAKAAGSGTLAGTLNANVLGADAHTFSDLVLSAVPNSGSSTSFTISGTDLTSTTSGLLHFFNLPSGDATLSSLGVGSGALTPSFGSATRSYQVTVPNGTTSITFTPTANNADHQQIQIIHAGGNAVVTSGQASSALNLTLGRNTFDIEVTAENGSTSSYEVVVFRQLSQQVDWVYGDVSITEPDGSVSTASAFTDMYGASRTSALSDDVTLDEDGLPQKTITLKVGDVLHLPMTSNHGNAMGYGGISGAENHICKIDGFTKNFGTQSGHYTIRALKAGACNGVFVTVHQRSTMVMLSLGARGIDLGSTYYRTPFVNIVVERKDQIQGALYNGASSNSSTAVWNVPQTLEIKTTGQAALGNKSYTHISGPCTITTKPVVIAGVSYFFAATAEVVGTGVGSCVIEGSQAQDNIYNAKTWSHTITFTQATQTLAFTSNVPAEPVVGSSYSPTATSSAMLPVTFTVTTGNGTVCNISSGVVSFITTGSCTIQATGISSANYQAPAPITQTLVVGTANQSITFNQIPDKELGDVAFRAMANASSGLAVSFTTVTSNTICTVSTAGLVTIVGEGQCSVTANQSGNSQVGAAQSVTRVFTIRPEGSSAPFITAVSYGDGSLTATLIAPSYTGGNSILDYSLFAYNAGNQNVALVTGCDASATPVRCTITGLTNGQPYTLKAAARTSAGLGSLSGPSQAVTPLANPQAVNALTALAGNQTLTITWQPPSSLGGGDFARFDIRIRPAGGNFPGLSAPSATISAITESSYVFTGLQNGVSYDVEMITITTEPASGMNAATLQSHTARVLQTPFTRPNAPRNLAAFEVDNAVKIAFAYPDFDGGRQVDEYRVSVNGTTVCTPTQIQVCSVPMATLTSLMSSPFVGGIGFQQQPGSFGFLSTTTQIPIEVVAVNDGGTSDPATTTYNLVTGSSTPPPSSGGNGVVGAITNLPTITSYSKQVLQSTGDSFTITGTNFDLIAEIWASNTKLSFIRSEENLIRITTPELPLGPHSLVLRGSFGVVTVQDAVNVIEGRILGESTRITRTFVDGFTGRSTYLGPTNVAKLRSFVAGVKPGTVIKCYGSIPDRAKMDNIKLAFKRADRVCDFVQSLNPNIEVVRTWVWKDGNEAWDRSQVRLTLFEY